MFNQIVKAVKTNYKKPDELRPAKAKAIAGRKPVPMTDEEKQRQRERLLAVSDEEKKEAMERLGNFITKTIKKWGFNLRNGPFCNDELQGNAKDVISFGAYCAIYYGERRWPEKIDLKTVLCGTAWSMMDHIVKKYAYRKTHPTYSIDDETIPDAMESLIEKYSGVSMEMGMRALGIEIAKKAVGDNELFLRYLDALQYANCYDMMAEQMHMTEREVMKVEKKLLNYLANL